MNREKIMLHLEKAVPMSNPAAVVAMPHPLVMEHAVKRFTLLSRWMSRAVSNGVASAKLVPLANQPQVWDTLFRMQMAVLEQVQQQQVDWMQGWQRWMEELGQVKRVNTVSKLVEQEFNLAAQLVVFFQERNTSFVNLLENAQVNYSYWLNQELTPPTSPAVVG